MPRPSKKSSPNVPAKKTEKRTRERSAESPTPNKVRKTDTRDSPNPPPLRIVEEITPRRMPNDNSQYRILKLSNGLRVALISKTGSTSDANDDGASLMNNPLWGSIEPEYRFIPESFGSTPEDICCTGPNHASSDGNHTTSTSVALVVNVGGYDDPFNYQGLAHFTEHMVHYGSKKFPRYDQVGEVVTNFGTYNAGTGELFTIYYNQVPDLILDQNLNLFEDMLSQPNFPEDMLMKEVHAIDNEFDLRHLSIRRAQLCAHVGLQNQNHPIARFMCGSLETLGRGTKDGAKRVRNVMQETHREYYVASAMTMAFASTKPIEELKGLALKHAASFLKGDREVRHETNLEDSLIKPFVLKNTADKAYIYHQGICSMAELTFSWILKSEIRRSDDEDKSIFLVLLLFQLPGKGSLLDFLENEELAWGVNVKYSSTPFAFLLDLSVQLSEKGRLNTDRVQQVVFRYLEFLQKEASRDKLKSLFEMLQVYIIQLHLRQLPALPQIYKAMFCAKNLQDIEDPASVMTHGYATWQSAKYDHERFLEIVETLQNKKNLILIETLPKNRERNAMRTPLEEIRKDYRNVRIESAPYTQAKFLVVGNDEVGEEPLPFNAFKLQIPNSLLKEEEIKIWRRNFMGNDGGGDASLSLPIPTNCGVIKPQQLQYQSRSDIQSPTSIPKIFGYHHGNNKKSGRSRVLIHFVTPGYYMASPTTYALLWIWGRVIQRNLAAALKELTFSGYDCTIRSLTNLRVDIQGFPKHITKAVDIVISGILKSEIKETTFNLAKEEAKVLYEMKLGQSQLISKALQNRFLYTQSQSAMSVDVLDLIENLKLGDLEAAIVAFRKSTHAVVHLFDNIPVSEFAEIARVLDSVDFGPFMGFNPYLQPVSNKLTISSEGATPGENCVRARNYGSCAFTSLVLNTYVLGPSRGPNAGLFNAAMLFIRHFAFMYLRTENQLAYAVDAASINPSQFTVPHMLFTIAVASTARKHTLCEIDEKIDKFLTKFGDKIAEMDDDLFDKMAELKSFPEDVTKERVAAYINSKFKNPPKSEDLCLRHAGNFVRKLTIQVTPAGNPESVEKKCSCCVCSSIQKWVPGKNEMSSLEFAVGSGKTKNYFIMP